MKSRSGDGLAPKDLWPVTNPEEGRHIARRRYWGARATAIHVYHEKRVARVSWVSVSMHACDPVPIVIGLRLTLGPPTLRCLTIRLWAQDFYEVIVDEAEGRINYHLIEIESE